MRYVKGLHAKKQGHFCLKQLVPLYKSKKWLFNDERCHTLVKIHLTDNIEIYIFVCDIYLPYINWAEILRILFFPAAIPPAYAGFLLRNIDKYRLEGTLGGH